jgi:hypothetical protein
VQSVRSTIGTDTASGEVQPEGADMDITDIELDRIELEPLSSPGRSVPTQRPARTTSVAGWVAIGLAVVATGTLALLVVRNDAGTRSSTDQADREQAAAVLPAASPAVVGIAAGRGAPAYDACRPASAGSADSMERFVQQCRRNLQRAVYVADKFRLCVPDGGGSADSMERWVEDCRSDVERALVEGARTPRCVSEVEVCLEHRICRPVPGGSADSMERWAERCALGLTGGAP